MEIQYKHGNLGKIVAKALGLKVCLATQESLPPGCAYDGALTVGKFIFGPHSHSTGISLHVYIENPDTLETYEIVNGTYWFSESTYGFNTFKWETGKWDKAFEDAIETLKIETGKAEALIKAEEDEFIAVNLKKTQEAKELIEGLF